MKKATKKTVKKVKKRFKIKPERSFMPIDQGVLDGLQSLANQFMVEIAGTVTPMPTVPPPGEAFDVKPQ